MSDDYKVKIRDGGKVTVILHPNCSISKEDIVSLLEDTGINSEDISFMRPEEVNSECAPDDKEVIIPVDSETVNDFELENVAMHCANNKASVTVVFGPDCSYEGMHPIAENYGNQCSWSSADLSDRLSKVDAPPLDASGTVVVRSRSKQVDCK